MKIILLILLVITTIFSTSTHQPLLAQTKVADFTFGGATEEIFISAVATADGGLIAGATTLADVGGDITQPPRGPATGANFDFWIVRLDARGNKLWDKRYGGSADDRLVKIVAAPDGGFLLCGWTKSDAGLDRTEPIRGNYDYWVVKIDAQGNKQWDKRFGSRDLDVLKSAVASPDGGYLLVGFATTPLSAPDQSSPNEDRTQPILGGTDIWIVKIDAQGNKQWDKRLGGNGAEDVYDVVSAPNGDFILACLPFENGGNLIHGGDVTGSGFSTYDYWMVRIDAQGNKIWDKTYGGSGQDIVRALLATPDGGVLAVGGSQSPVSGNKSTHIEGKDCWLLKLDALGNKQWEQVYGSTLPLSSEYIYTMINNPAGGYILGGGTSQVVAPNFPFDFWLVDIDADGTVRGEQTLGGDKNDGMISITPSSGGTTWLVGESNSDISRDKTANSRGGHDIWVVKLGSTVLATKESADLGASISLFPNPVDQGVVTLEANGLRDQLSVRTEILNSLGQRVQLLQIPVRQSTISHQLNLAQLAQGVYTVRIFTSSGTITKQLVKN